MKNIAKISIIALAASVLATVSCSKWTEPKNLDFHRQTPEQLDPAAYEAYLSGIRDYKKSEHKLMFVTMKAYASHPSTQSMHIVAMPDSADVVCVTMVDEEINPVIAAEIDEVLKRKSTEVFLNVDYAPIHTAWGLLEDKRADEGRPAATDEEITAFFKAQTEAQLENCGKYGFHGIQVTFVGNRATHYAQVSQDAYIAAVMDYYKKNPSIKLMFRGSARNIESKEFLDVVSHIVIIAGEEKKLSSLVTRLGTAPTNRIIMEVTVPSVDNPVQIGRSAVEAAEWVIAESANEKFTPLGVAVSNAYDDYFNKTLEFWNIKKAMATMNPSQTEESEK